MKKGSSGFVAHSLCALSFVFASMLACASGDFDWAAAASAGDGCVTVPDGQTATVVDADIPAFADITNITCAGTASRILFQNTQPFTVTAEIGGPGGNGTGQAVLEMTNETGKITFAKKVYFNEGRRIILGNVDILGLFGADRSNTYGSLTALAGCTVDFKAGSSLQREYINYLYGSGTYKFASKIPGTSAAGYLSFSTPTVVFNADNLLNAGYVVSGDATFDLNGHPQAVGYVSGGTVTVKSATPAALTLNGTTASSFKFALQGAASLVYSNTAKMTVEGGVSSTTGSLDVKSGIVELKSNASFRAGAINVSGGELMLSVATATGAGTDVVVTGTGVLNIPSVTSTLRSLTILGEEIDLSDPVTVASLAVRFPANVKGAGSIRAPLVRFVSPTGDDGADGKTASTAYRSLKKAVTVACLSGDTIMALPGTYEEEVMTSAAGEGYSRVVIPAGVTLKSRDGAAATTILGKQATTPISGFEQCGADSARCVTMKTGAHLVGFTLTGGYPTTDGTTSCASSAIGASGDDNYIVDCIITNCYSPSNYTCRYGKYLRCRIQNCRTKLTYACGVRDAHAFDCTFKGFTNNGYMDTAQTVVNCTFDSGAHQALRGTDGKVIWNSIIISTASKPADLALTYRNCIFTTQPSNGTLLDCLVTNVTAINTATWTIGEHSVARGFADRAKYEELLRAAGFTDDEIGSGTDVNGVPRVQAGALDAGASQYDRRGEFAAILAPDGTLEVTWADADVAPAGNGMDIPDGQTLALDWQMPPLDATTFQFEADLSAGASLDVCTNGVLMTTVTTSGKVNFTGHEGIALRLVATGAVTVGNFKNGARTYISVPNGGVIVTGIETNAAVYVGAEPLTVTVRRVYDSFDRYATGFTANGTFVSFDDHPDGWEWTHTVSDIDSSLLLAVVYGESPTNWYVDAVSGSDTENYGRVRTNPLKTLKAAAERATSGHTIHAAAGMYAEGVMNFSGEATAEGLYRVVVPSGVALVADEGAERTFIVGAKAEPADARLALDGCGTNSVRGVYLNTGATLRNFTVTGCYGFCTVGQDGVTKTGEYAGGIRSRSASPVAHIYDCIISNNFAWGGAGAHCGIFTRCKFLANRSQLGWRIGFTGVPGYAFNCYFADQTCAEGTAQAHVTDINMAVNCTFIGEIGGVRSAGSEVWCYNCLFKSWPTTSSAGGARFYGCLAPTLPTQYPEMWTGEAYSNAVVTAAQLVLDDVTHAPAAKDLATVDSEIAWGYYTNQVSALIPAAEYAQDLNGNPRVYDAKLDAGAAEFDWRGDFARCLSSRHVSVIAASANVQTNGASLKLPAGTLAVAWSGGKAGDTCTFVTRQTGDGTLTVRLGDAALEPVSVDGGTSAYAFRTSADLAELSFAFEGEGFVDLSALRRVGGLIIQIR